MSTPMTPCHVRPNLKTMSSPRPLPVASAVRSQISCTAAIRGKVRSATQRIPEAELGASLGIGGDSGRVVVRRSGDQSRPEGA